MPDRLSDYRNELINEVENDILKFWINNTVDEENGGFYGSISSGLKVKKDAPKGVVLLSRILWTFSQAYKIFGKPVYLEMADRSYQYMIEHAIDRKYGGVFWLLSHKGEPLETKKQIYAQAFAIYALSEYYSAAKKTDALNMAAEIFGFLEKYAYDAKYKGYYDACSSEWSLMKDMSLSDKDINCRKSMNTNLHILEAYTNLARYAGETESGFGELLMTRLRELINTTTEHIIDKSACHFMLYFDDEWNSLKEHISYGHDIEGSWLLYEAALATGEKKLIERIAALSVKMAEAVYCEGIDKDGAIANDGDSYGIINTSRDWWPQAEAMVGFFNAYQLSGDGKFLDASIKVWNFVKENLIDPKYGEWYWSVDENGKIDHLQEKVGIWKCPYHNSRSCFELKTRIDEEVGKEMSNEF